MHISSCTCIFLGTNNVIGIHTYLHKHKYVSICLSRKIEKLFTLTFNIMIGKVWCVILGNNQLHFSVVEY